MNEIDRLRTRILEQRAARTEPEPRKTSMITLGLLIGSLALVTIIAAAVKFL